MSAAPTPRTALAAYNSHVLGHRNDTMNRLLAKEKQNQLNSV